MGTKEKSKNHEGERSEGKDKYYSPTQEMSYAVQSPMISHVGIYSQKSTHNETATYTEIRTIRMP